MDSRLVIRCGGRPVDRALQPAGEPCGRTHPRRGHRTDAEYRDSARAAGWRLGPDTATCPACSRPDPDTARLCRELAREAAS